MAGGDTVRRLALLVAASVAVAGCSPKPAMYAEQLSVNDPKWESEDCKAIRLAALNHDDKVGQRAALGLASGLLLGPFGLPIAVAADMDQDEQRRIFSREMHLRCSSLPLPDNLKVAPPPVPSPSSKDTR